MDGKVAIVTGGSRGIGTAICLELAKKGAKVALTYVSESSKVKAEAVVKQINEIRGSEGNAIAIQADMSDLASPQKIVDGTLNGLKTSTIHILINNAGVSENKPLGELTVDHYNKQMDTNVRGVIFLTQAVIPHLPEKDGRIVNLSSISATAGLPTQTVYAASKAAIDGLTKVWARELGAKCRCTVNCVNPGPVDTDMYAGTSDDFDKFLFRRFDPAIETRKATAKDIADIVVFLASDEARWITGDVVCANGGAVWY